MSQQGILKSRALLHHHTQRIAIYHLLHRSSEQVSAQVRWSVLCGSVDRLFQRMA